MAHVFLSYVNEDADRVARLAEELRQRGAQVWIDKHDIAAGKRWKDEIEQAIQSGGFFIACFSHNYEHRRDRTFMNVELDVAIDELSMRGTDRAWFLPVLLDPVEVPDRRIGGMDTLRDIQAVRLYEDWDDGVARLVAAIAPSAAAAEAEARLRLTAPVMGPQQSEEVDHPPIRWSPADTVQVRERAQPERVFAVEFHPDGSLLATISTAGTAQLWTVPRLEKRGGPLGHDGTVRRVAFSPDGRTIATAGADLTVRIWQVHTGKLQFRLRHDDAHNPDTFLPELAFNKSGTLLAVADLQGKLRVWDLGTGRAVKGIPEVKHVRSLAFRPFHHLVVAGSSDGTSRVIDVDSGDAIMVRGTWSYTRADLVQVAVSPDARLLVSVAEDGNVRGWELESGAEVPTLQRADTAHVVLSSRGRRMVEVRKDGTVQVSEIDTGRVLGALPPPHGVRKLACVADACLLATVGRDHRVHMSTLAGEVASLDHGGVFDLAFSPDDRLLATAGGNQVRLWACRER